MNATVRSWGGRHVVIKVIGCGVGDIVEISRREGNKGLTATIHKNRRRRSRTKRQFEFIHPTRNGKGIIGRSNG